MFKFRSALIAVTLAASGVTAIGTVAEAAPAITIHQIPGKTIAATATTTIRPQVGHGSHIAIASKSITVKAGAKTIADHKASARLKPGTYRVTTAVTYKAWQISAGQRQYSSAQHVSKTQILQIKAKAAAKKPAASHPCTTTASGNCIAGGQFCPQAKYGQDGWDGSGRRYVCTGDSTHPHWMTP